MKVKTEISKLIGTIAIVREIIEGIGFGGVGEFVVASRKFLETLSSNLFEIAGEFGVLSQNQGASCHKSIYQRLITR